MALEPSLSKPVVLPWALPPSLFPHRRRDKCEWQFQRKPPDEGPQERCPYDIIKSINKTSVPICSPLNETALMPLAFKLIAQRQAPSPPLPHPNVLQEKWALTRCSASIIITQYGEMRGLQSHEPLPAGCHPLLDPTLDGWLLWKPPNAKEERRRYTNIVRFEISDTSALHSLSHKTVSTPCRPKPFAHRVVSSTGTALNHSTEWFTWLFAEPTCLPG